MSDSMYPKCPKCEEGTLLPFFNNRGVNIYVCTHCEVEFGTNSSSGHEGIKGSLDCTIRYFEKKRCPQCNSLMIQSNSGKWYCYNCEDYKGSV